MPPVEVKRDINLGTLIPVVLFLTVQTLGAVWWAATMTAQFDALQEYVRAETDNTTERINLIDQNRITDRQRILDRLVRVEGIATELAASERATSEIVEAIKDDINALREDLRDNNSLLRELLQQRSNP